MKSVPLSSKLYDIAMNYKQWRMKFVQKQYSFYGFFFMKAAKPFKSYDIFSHRLLLSGDVELNPGPMLNNTSIEDITFTNPDFVLRYRMLRHGLQPLDVGGAGDCLFKAVSHQLYGDSNHHLEIRATAVRFLSDNPERFIESVVETTWAQYLSNMSKQGTWADNIVIQSISDAMRLKIHIIESSQNFTEVTTIEPALSIESENIQSIYIYMSYR